MRVPAADVFANFTWLPVCPTSVKPTASSLRLTSRNASGFMGFDVHFDIAHVRYDCRDRRREMKFESVAQVLESLVFSRTLAGNVNLHTLSDVPLAFLPDACGE